ncbi:MAG TPA: GNAT family N-acetyltransferase [Thermoleophilaceae bacterium]|nr:GNAT family N-acetyltransferase [Thermoleophilaceae bacterium]
MTGAQVALADGAEIEIRPIEPEDRDELAAGLRRLSPESRYRRFLAPTHELSDPELDYLTRVDHHDHEALVAQEPDTGAGIGVARFIRIPEEPDKAEFAVAVADDWQGRGVGGALLARLSDRARAEGVRRFSAVILADNRPMLELLDDLGEVRFFDVEFGAVEVEIDLPAEGVAAALRRTMRAAARGELSLRPRWTR